MLLGNIDEEFIQKAVQKSTLEEGIKKEKDRMILSLYTNGVDISIIANSAECDGEYVKRVIKNMK